MAVRKTPLAAIGAQAELIYPTDAKLTPFPVPCNALIRATGTTPYCAAKGKNKVAIPLMNP